MTSARDSDKGRTLREYFASDPPSALAFVYRLVLLALVGVVLVVLSAIRHGVDLTQKQVKQVATAVATQEAPGSAPP